MFSCCCAKKDDIGITVPAPSHTDFAPDYQDDIEDVWWQGEDGAEYGDDYYPGAYEEEVWEEQEQEEYEGEPAAEQAEAAAAECPEAAAVAEEVPSTPEVNHPEPTKEEPTKEEPKNDMPPKKFSVKLTRKCIASPWGLAADLADGQTIFVSGVSTGDFPTGRYNKAAKPERKLQDHDYIVAVNGITASGAYNLQRKGLVEQMGQELQRSISVTLMVQRPQHFDMVIERQNEPIGLDLNFNSKGRSLVVCKVLEGAVARCAPDIVSFDRILAVNGKRGLPEDLLQALKNSGSRIEMAMARCP